MSERRQVLKHSGYLLLARLFARLASVPFLIYAANSLKPELFGIFTFTLAAVDMLSALGDFGLSRYGAREFVREGEQRNRLAGIFLTLQLLASVALTVPAVALVLALTGPPKEQVLLLGLAAAFMSSFVFTTDTIFTATRRFGASAVLAVVGRAVYLVAGFLVLALGYSVVAVMTAFLLGMAVESVLRLTYTAVRVTGFSFHFTRDDFWRVIRGAAPFTVSALATLVYFRADTLIMEAIRGDIDVGIYSAAYSFFSFFVWVPIILTRTLLPGMTQLFAEKPQEAERLNWFWYRGVGILGIPVAFTVTMLAGPLIRSLLPASYADSVLTLQVLMWSIPVLMMVSVGFNALVVADHEKPAANTTLTTAAFIVGLDFALIPRYGVIGAAAAMVATTVFWFAQVHWLLRRHLLAPGHNLATALDLPLGGGLFMAGTALLVKGLGVAVALVAGLAVYAAIVGMVEGYPMWRRQKEARGSGKNGQEKGDV